MKRLLAIILSLTLIGGIMPAALAADEATETTATTYTYNFNNVALGAELVKNSDGTYRDFANLKNSTNVSATKSGETWTVLALNMANARVYDSGIISNIKIAQATDGFLTFEINLPQKGTYKPTVTYDMAKAGGKIGARIISNSEKVSEGYDIDDKTGIANLRASLPLADSDLQETHDASLSSFTFTGNVKKNLTTVNLDKGANYAVFNIEGYNSSIDAANEETTDTFTHITLEVLNLTLEKIPVSNLEFSQTKTYIKTFETVDFAAKAFDADKNEIIDEITYESTNDSIATVDASTGVVTAISPGTVIIKATDSTGTVTATTEIVVSDIIYNYEFTPAAVDIEKTNSFKNIGMVDYNKINTDVSFRWNNVMQNTNWFGVVAEAGGSGMRMNTSLTAKLNNPGHNAALRIYVEESGEYAPVLNYFKCAFGVVADMYIIDEATVVANGWDMTTDTDVDKAIENASPNVTVDTYDGTVETHFDGGIYSEAADSIKLEKGEYYLVFNLSDLNAAIDSNQNNVVDIDGVDNTNEKITDPDTGKEVSKYAGRNATLLVHSLDLVKVADYTPVEDTANNEDLTGNATVTVSIDCDVDDAINTSLNDTVASVTVGSTVTAEAKENVGASTFMYWAYGNGDVISYETELSFVAASNVYIEAVYHTPKDGASTARVEFWDANGELLGYKNIDVNTAFDGIVDMPTPSMKGYEFDKWSAAGTTVTGYTRAVAQYKNNGTAEEPAGTEISGTVSVNGTAVTSPAYDQKITATATTEKIWKRDDRPVFIGTEYNHYIWGPTVIRSSSAAYDTKPLAALDSDENGIFMLEYFVPMGYNIVEAGILFGDADSTITSAYAKARVKNLKTHGQFTAKAYNGADADAADKQPKARGYIVYEKGGEHKVVYTAAK